MIALLAASIAVPLFADTTIPMISVSPEVLESNESGVDDDQIQRVGATRLQDVLHNTHGVQILSLSGGQNPIISIRGFGQNAFGNTLMVVDDVPRRHIDQLTPTLSMVDLNDIQQIEVDASSQSVRYGDSAVGGVLRIETKAPEKPVRTIGATVGSYHAFRYNMRLSELLGNGVYYDLVGSRTRSDNYRDHDASSHAVIKTKLGFKNSSSDSSLQYILFNGATQYPGVLTSEQVGDDRRMNQPGTDGFFSHSRIQDVVVKSAYHVSQSSNFDIVANYQVDKTFGNMFSDFQQSRFSRQISPVLTTVFNNGATLTSGVQLSNDRYHYETTSNYVANDGRKTLGLFSLIKLPINEALDFGLGGRWAGSYDDLNGVDNLSRVFVSEQAIYYTYSERLSAYLRHSTNYRFPKVDEQNNADMSAPPKILSTQRGDSYEAGLKYQDGALGLTADLYKLDLNNEISYVPPAPDEVVGTNRNLDPTSRTGLTLGASYKLSKELTGKLDYHFVRARFNSGAFEGNSIPYVAQNTLRLALSSTLNDNIELTGEGLYTGSRYAADDDANVDSQLGGFTIYNASARYSYKQFSAAIRLNNIFNKHYYSYALYVVPFAGVPYRGYYPASERNVNMTVTYDFA